MPGRPDESGSSLTELLGGRTGFVDAAGPAVAFVVGWTLAGRGGSGDSQVAIWWGAGAALRVGVILGVYRWSSSGKRPAAVVLGLLGVIVAAMIALRTGHAADFFLLQIASNAASALVWTLSILVRWPLLGVIVGLMLGQRFRWRADPDLSRGYRRASWLWVGQYLVRLAVFVPLYRADQVVALGIARALTWMPVLACVALSWPVLRTALPTGHGGIRHPRRADGSEL
jgi:hypothetical protein